MPRQRRYVPADDDDLVTPAKLREIFTSLLTPVKFYVVNGPSRGKEIKHHCSDVSTHNLAHRRRLKQHQLQEHAKAEVC